MSGHLLLTLLPLTLLASISPVVFLNASTVTSNRGVRGGVRFLAGNALALSLLGTAAIGLLGASAADVAVREITSRRVDIALGAALLMYAAWMLRRHVDDARRDPADDGDALPRRGIFTWGVIGMLTNFTTLPLYVSAMQRAGASSMPGWGDALIFVIVTAIVLTPAWSPVVIARFVPDHSTVSARARARIARSTRIASITACLIGATFLLWHALR